MEILIVICLLIVIVLLAKDKIIINKMVVKPKKPSYVNPNLPEIMGVPKPRKSLSVENTRGSNLSQEGIKDKNIPDSELRENDFDIEIPREELDEIFGIVPDLEEEEEEWRDYCYSSGGDDSFGFATGVTFEELGTIGFLLQQETLESSQQNLGLEIIQKIQGTELFNLLENSMENASQRIAKLLNESFSIENDSGSSTIVKNNFEDFDVKEFI